MRVLIVDDDERWSCIAAAMLRPVADRVRFALSFGAAKAEIAKPNGFDVVLLDLHLPDSGAGETVAHIPDIKATGRKVVVVTGLPITKELRAAARARGACDCLSKNSINLADQLKAACT